MSVAEGVYRLTMRFPREELYGMTAQIRRAAVSVAANIAEGYGRDNRGSFVQFLRMSQGSLKEVETHLVLSTRVNLAAPLKWSRSCGNVMSLARCCAASYDQFNASNQMVRGRQFSLCIARPPLRRPGPVEFGYYSPLTTHYSLLT
jgi:four helix bundle protein